VLWLPGPLLAVLDWKTGRRLRLLRCRHDGCGARRLSEVEAAESLADVQEALKKAVEKAVARRS
jgi:hypothetical protein